MAKRLRSPTPQAATSRDDDYILLSSTPMKRNETYTSNAQDSVENSESSVEIINCGSIPFV